MNSQLITKSKNARPDFAKQPLSKNCLGFQFLLEIQACKLEMHKPNALSKFLEQILDQRFKLIVNIVQRYRLMCTYAGIPNISLDHNFGWQRR